MSKEERLENRQWNDAVRELKRAYNQMSTFEWKVVEEEPERAARHLRKALDEYNGAMTHIEKAEVGADQAGAVDDLNKGIKALDEAVTALDDGDVDLAQSHYDKAAACFDKAKIILD